MTIVKPIHHTSSWLLHRSSL